VLKELTKEASNPTARARDRRRFFMKVLLSVSIGQSILIS